MAQRSRSTRRVLALMQPSTSRRSLTRVLRRSTAPADDWNEDRGGGSASWLPADGLRLYSCATIIATGDPAAPTVPLSVTLTLGDNVVCTFVNQQQVSQTTRTQGFWATHSSITEAVWFGGTVGGNTFPGVTDKTLCGESISTLRSCLAASGRTCLRPPTRSNARISTRPR
jgi:hypothetical protein